MTVGPSALELYRRVASAYGHLEEFDKARESRTKDKGLWRYECHVGERVIFRWLKEENIDIFINTPLKGTGNGDGVVKKGTAIKSIITEKGDWFSAPYFVDATYEGDLFAAAGVNFTIGRESVVDFEEPFAGVQYNSTYSNLQVPVDPYVEPGIPGSGLIPTVQGYPLREAGSRYVYQ